MHKIATAFTLLFLISGCISQPSEPLVASFNGDSVDIQIDNIEYLTAPALAISRANADARAQEICERGPKKKAEFASARKLYTANQYIVHELRLYLCLD
ncbi:hypothetical protein SAMN06273572_10264 [Monaibacterium marinum]|uniref:Lipoprotein n=1 Tax=Pontivivens marinum TaxID=1690039 RepID=A0A2C9CQ88_9RHOB|nr:hypothetical protein SAMN06273572_10264 [Monaibacterium marinum]